MEKKTIIKWTLWLLSFWFICFFLWSLWIMILVNSWFTNEESWKWWQVSLTKEWELDKLFENKLANWDTKTKFKWFEWFNKEKDLEEQYKKFSIDEIDYKWISEDMEFLKIKQKRDEAKVQEIKENNKSEDVLLDDNLKNVYNCLNEWLIHIDSFFENAEMNFDEIYEISTHVWYIVPTFSVYKNYCAQDPNWAIEKKEEIIKPWKFKDMIIKDLYEWPIAQFIKNFMNDWKNKAELQTISDLLKIDSKIIMSIVLVEQLRAAETDRDRVKRLAEKSMLNSFTMFSLWIAWMKVSTADKIESYLKDPKSEFYLWKEYEDLFKYSRKDKWQERYDRLTDNNSYYWQYLYTAVQVKMFQKQWDDQWFNIDDKAWILWTLYNIWKSSPKQNPSLWWATIQYQWKWYLFWELTEKNFIFLITKLKK